MGHSDDEAEESTDEHQQSAVELRCRCNRDEAERSPTASGAAAASSCGHDGPLDFEGIWSPAADLALPTRAALSECMMVLLGFSIEVAASQPADLLDQQEPAGGAEPVAAALRSPGRSPRSKRSRSSEQSDAAPGSQGLALIADAGSSETEGGAALTTPVDEQPAGSPGD